MLQNPASNTPFDSLVTQCAPYWDAYCQHEFVRQLANGTLPPEAFRHYLRQDYLFLVHFARAWGLAVYKSRNITELRQGLDSLKAIVDLEMGLHVDYCSRWGITEDELKTLPEERETMAYTRYVLDAGHRGDLLDLHVALVPCLVGYAEISKWIDNQPDTITAPRSTRTLAGPTCILPITAALSNPSFWKIPKT